MPNLAIGELSVPLGNDKITPENSVTSAALFAFMLYLYAALAHRFVSGSILVYRIWRVNLKGCSTFGAGKFPHFSHISSPF